MLSDLVLSESYQVATVIHKLPPSWNSFKMYLMFKNKEMTLEMLITKLQIEEQNQRKGKTMHSSLVPKANVVEQGQSSGNKKKVLGRHANKGKDSKLRPQGGVGKKQNAQFLGRCFNCDKVGQRSADFRKPLRQKDE